MEKQCSELLGSPMVYEVVEWVRESLTAHNRPCGQCALCLSDFMVTTQPLTFEPEGLVSAGGGGGE